MKSLCSVVFSLLLVANLTQAQAGHGAFVTTTGKDTFALEQYTRNGNTVSGSWVVFHPPGVFAHDYHITLGPDGVPIRYTMKYTTPGAATQPELDSVIVEYARDTAFYAMVYKDSTAKRIVVARDAFPMLGQSWIGLELGLARLRHMRVDSGVIVTNAPTQPSLGALRLPVKFLRADSAIIANNRALVSAEGSLLEMAAGPLAIHRVSSLDMATLVKGFVDAFTPRAAALAAAAASRVEIALPTAQLDKLVGEYSLNAAATVSITRDGEHLVFATPNGGRLTLLAQSQTQFFVRKPDLVLVFDVDANGVANAVTLVQGEGKQRLTRLAAATQARAQGDTGQVRDTLPEHVVQRMYEAFARHDLDATYADYASVFTYERFGDPAGSHQVRRDDNLRKMKADTTVLRIINGQRVDLVRSDAYGAFVIQEWREQFADGRVFKHFELVEVRGGKIVREIEGDRLLNTNR